MCKELLVSRYFKKRRKKEEGEDTYYHKGNRLNCLVPPVMLCQSAADVRIPRSTVGLYKYH